MPINKMFHDHQRALILADHAATGDDRRDQAELATRLGNDIADWREDRGLPVMTRLDGDAEPTANSA